MSAVELIEQVKALPPHEQLVFADFLSHWRPQSLCSLEPTEAVGPRWPDFMARLQKIYGDKVTSDSQLLISELRGER